MLTCPNLLTISKKFQIQNCVLRFPSTVYAPLKSIHCPARSNLTNERRPRQMIYEDIGNNAKRIIIVSGNPLNYPAMVIFRKLLSFKRVDNIWLPKFELYSRSIHFIIMKKTVNICVVSYEKCGLMW